MSRGRAKTRARQDVDLGMDSFIDVMANSIGVLTIILLFAAVVATRSARFLNVPRFSPLADLTIYNFEAVRGRVNYVDYYAIMQRVTDKLRAYRDLEDDDQRERLQRLNIEEGNYRLLPKSLPAGVVKLEVIDPLAGVSAADLENPDADFLGVLSTLNPTNDMLMFVVRMDGWDIFQDARKLASQRGFLVGWDLRANDRPIEFGIAAGRGAYQ